MSMLAHGKNEPDRPTKLGRIPDRVWENVTATPVLIALIVVIGIVALVALGDGKINVTLPPGR